MSQARKKRCDLVKNIILTDGGSRDISKLRLHVNPTEFIYAVNGLLRHAVKCSAEGDTIYFKAQLETQGKNSILHRQNSQMSLELLKKAAKLSSADNDWNAVAGLLRLQVIDNGNGFSEVCMHDRWL